MAEFDSKTQELLYRFYWKASHGKYEDLDGMIEDVALAIDQIKHACAPGWGSRMKLMLCSPRGGDMDAASKGLSDSRMGKTGSGTTYAGSGGAQSDLPSDHPSTGAPIK